MADFLWIYRQSCSYPSFPPKTLLKFINIASCWLTYVPRIRRQTVTIFDNILIPEFRWVERLLETLQLFSTYWGNNKNNNKIFLKTKPSPRMVLMKSLELVTCLEYPSDTREERRALLLPTGTCVPTILVTWPRWLGLSHNLYLEPRLIGCVRKFQLQPTPRISFRVRLGVSRSPPPPFFFFFWGGQR